MSTSTYDSNVGERQSIFSSSIAPSKNETVEDESEYILYQNPVESVIFEPFVEEESISLSSFSNIYSFAEFVYRGATQALVLTQKNLSLILTHRDHPVKLRSSRRTCVADHLPLLALPPKAILVGVAAFNSPPDGRPVIAITLIHSVSKVKSSPTPTCYLNIYGQRCPNGHDLGAIFSDWQSIQLSFVPFALRHTQLFSVTNALLESTGVLKDQKSTGTSSASVVHTDLIVTGSDGTAHVFRQWGLPIDTPSRSLGVVGDLLPLLDQKLLPSLTKTDVRTLRPALVPGLPASHTLSYLPIGFRAFPPVWGATIEGQPVLKPLVLPKLEEVLLGENAKGILEVKVTSEEEKLQVQSQQPDLLPGEPERPSFTASLYQEIRPDSALHPLPALVGCDSPATCLEVALVPSDGTRIVVAGLQNGTVRLLVSPDMFPKRRAKPAANSDVAVVPEAMNTSNIKAETKEASASIDDEMAADPMEDAFDTVVPKTFVAQRVLDGPISAISIFSSSALPQNSVRQHILLSNMFRDYAQDESLKAAKQRFSNIQECRKDSGEANDKNNRDDKTNDPSVTPMTALLARIEAFSEATSRVHIFSEVGEEEFNARPDPESVASQGMSTYHDLGKLDMDVHVAVASALGYVVVFSCVTRMLLDCATPVLGSDGFGPVTCLCVGDVDGDQRNELILGTATGRVVCFQSPMPYLSSVLPRPRRAPHSTQVLARIFDKLIPPLGAHKAAPTPQAIECLMDLSQTSYNQFRNSNLEESDSDEEADCPDTLPFLPAALGLGHVPVRLLKSDKLKSYPKTDYPNFETNSYPFGIQDTDNSFADNEYEDNDLYDDFSSENEDEDEDVFLGGDSEDDESLEELEEMNRANGRHVSLHSKDDESVKTHIRTRTWANWVKQIPRVPKPGSPSPFPLRFSPVWQRETAEPVLSVRLFRRRLQVNTDPFGLLEGAKARANIAYFGTGLSEEDAFRSAEMARMKSDQIEFSKSREHVETVEDGEPSLMVVMQQSVQILEANFISTSSVVAGKLTILRQIAELEDLLTRLHIDEVAQD